MECMDGTMTISLENRFIMLCVCCQPLGTPCSVWANGLCYLPFIVAPSPSRHCWHCLALMVKRCISVLGKSLIQTLTPTFRLPARVRFLLWANRAFRNNYSVSHHKSDETYFRKLWKNKIIQKLPHHLNAFLGKTTLHIVFAPCTGFQSI